MNRAHIADILLRRAEHAPDTVAFEFVDETGRLTSMTYAELADRAATLAARLPTGAPALLAYPAGLSYVVGVCGAFLAGVPVVPAYPPGASDADRLARIAADAGIGCVLAPEDAEFPTAAARIAVPERG